MTSKRILEKRTPRTMRVGGSMTNHLMTENEWEAIDRAAAASGLRWTQWVLNIVKSKMEGTPSSHAIRHAAMLAMYKLADERPPMSYTGVRLEHALQIVRAIELEQEIERRSQFQDGENDPMLENSALFGTDDYDQIMKRDLERVWPVYEAGGYIMHLGMQHGGQRALVIEDKTAGHHVVLGFPFTNEQWEAAIRKQQDALNQVHAHLALE